MNKNKRIEFTLMMLSALSVCFNDSENENYINPKEIEENFHEFLDAALTLVPTKIYATFTGEKEADGLQMHFDAIRIVSTNYDYDVDSREAGALGTN